MNLPSCSSMDTGSKAVHCGQLHACSACSIHRCPVCWLRSSVILTTADSIATFTCSISRAGQALPFHMLPSSRWMPNTVQGRMRSSLRLAFLQTDQIATCCSHTISASLDSQTGRLKACCFLAEIRHQAADLPGALLQAPVQNGTHRLQNFQRDPNCWEHPRLGVPLWLTQGGVPDLLAPFSLSCRTFASQLQYGHAQAGSIQA